MSHKVRLEAVFPALCIFIATIAADQGTKWIVVKVLMDPPRIVKVAPFFNLTLGFNTGVSFGLLGDLMAESQWLLVSLQTALVLALIVWALRVGRNVNRAALSMIAGGAMGNIFDRWRQGAVTDFLDFHLAGLHWPTFNFADVFIVLGVVLLLTSGLGRSNALSRKEAAK